MPDEQNVMPNIEDNAKGVAGHTLCVVQCWTKDGRKFRMQHVPRWVLEAGSVFSKIQQLSDSTGGLSRIVVEIEVP